MRKSTSKNAALRYSTLFAVSCMYMGVYWVYDLPSALSIQLRDYLSLSDLRYTYLLSALYIAFAVPSIILPFLSGIAVQRYSTRTLMLWCVVSVISSQVGFCIALQSASQAGLIFARMLLGVGGEVLGVLGSEVLTRWFPGSETGLAMAVYESLSTLGTVANSNATPRLTSRYDVPMASWVSVSLATILLASSTVFILIVDRAERMNDSSKQESLVTSIRQLPRRFWYIAGICLAGSSCQLPFFNSAQRFLAERYFDNNQTTAGTAVSIVHLLGGLLPMLVGLVLEVQILRNYSMALLFSQLFMLVTHALLLADYRSPIVPMVVLSIGNAIFGAAIWASVSVSIIQADDLEPVQEQALPMLDPGHDREAEDTPESADTTSPSASVCERIRQIDVPEGPLTVLGYGIITSLMGVAIVVTPVFLSIAEDWAGFAGVESVFVALALGGVLISLALVVCEKALT